MSSGDDIIGALGERAVSPPPHAAGHASGSDSDGTFGDLLKDVKGLLAVKAPPRQADVVANEVAQISRRGIGASAGKLAQDRLAEAAIAAQKEAEAEASLKESVSDDSPSISVSSGLRRNQQSKRDRSTSDDDMTVTSSDGGGSSESPIPIAKSLSRSKSMPVDKMDAQDSSSRPRPQLQRRATMDGPASASATVAHDQSTSSSRRQSAPSIAPGNVPVPMPKVAAGPKGRNKDAPSPPVGLRDGLRTQHIQMLCALDVMASDELSILLSQWQQEWLHTSGRATDQAVQSRIATKEEQRVKKEQRMHTKHKSRESSKHTERNASQQCALQVPINSGKSSLVINPPASELYSEVLPTHGRLAEWRGAFR